MNYLCLDYGEKNIGIAFSTGTLAEPLVTIDTATAIPTIVDLLGQYAINTIVIGISENIMADKTRAFARKLQAETDLPIDFHDETLTSQETRLKVAQMGMKRSRREGKIDHLVAAAILEDYLDSHPAHPDL
jgi:putative Holliday junction resolvase